MSAHLPNRNPVPQRHPAAGSAANARPLEVACKFTARQLVERCRWSKAIRLHRSDESNARRINVGLPHGAGRCGDPRTGWIRDLTLLFPLPHNSSTTIELDERSVFLWVLEEISWRHDIPSVLYPVAICLTSQECQALVIEPDRITAHGARYERIVGLAGPGECH